ncbi:MAG TPA: choice-of-anchor tandem repeat GloVer-containing protein, partial [Stellaceae bacterium]|nr:choice-of-anchor tandem repeat GloVer-containing protein [Stellaceae bacterium]
GAAHGPVSGLIVGPDGALYGTSEHSGANARGTAYRLELVDGAWTFRKLYSFAPAPGEPADPASSLIFGADGTLYGTSILGGGSNGTVYQLEPATKKSKPWVVATLYAFGQIPQTSTTDGKYPNGELVADANGNLYGTTSQGGSAACGCGTVVEVSPPTGGATAWTETVLYSFTGQADGARPLGGLVFDAAGNLYGTTSTGGQSSAAPWGTVFELSPPTSGGTTWTETTLYAFTDGDDGADPGAELAIDAAGNLYGTTSQGGAGNGGTVFELTP